MSPSQIHRSYAVIRSLSRTANVYADRRVFFDARPVERLVGDWSE